MIDNKEKFDKICELSTFKSIIEKEINCDIEYFGLGYLNPEKYPFFVQWGHSYPVLRIKDSGFIKIPKEIAFGIELALDNVKDINDFQKQINEAFSKKEKLYEKSKVKEV